MVQQLMEKCANRQIQKGSDDGATIDGEVC
jgi:hypothetical protein